MAGDEQGQVIALAGLPHRARGAADALRQFAVAEGLTARDAQHFRPHAALEFAAAHFVKRQRPGVATGEIGLEPATDIPRRKGRTIGHPGAVLEVDADQNLAIEAQVDAPGRTVEEMALLILHCGSATVAGYCGATPSVAPVPW